MILSVAEMKNLILKNGGFSISPSGKKASGFMVSKMDYIAKPISEFTQSDIDNAPVGKNDFLGGWLDTETGIVYLDISESYQDKMMALDVASDRKQLAIYDVKNDMSIYL